MSRAKSFITAFISPVIAICVALTGCNPTSSIGNEIVSDSIAIVIDTSFTVTGTTVSDSVVLSRTVSQMLGTVEAPDYGVISSQVVTQFMPSADIDTTRVPVENIDSLSLVFRTSLSSTVGDRYAITGIEVFALNRQLSAPIYSDFNPKGYYDPAKPIASSTFNLSTIGQPDSLLRYGVFEFRVSLPVELGRELYAKYRQNPSTFANPSQFAKIFPGLFIRNSFGSGRITRMTRTTMQMHYHKTFRVDSTGRDTTTYHVGNYFAVTPEIISNNNINLKIDKSIRKLIDDGQHVILTPAGTSMTLRFPTPEILQSFRSGTAKGHGVINTLSLSIPVEEIENKYEITPPPCLLLVLEKDKNQFFLDNKLTDDKTSFYAEYDSKTKSYSFDGLRQYILDCATKENLQPEDYTFSLIAVNLLTETVSDYYGQTQTYVTGIIPYVTEPKMAKILLEKAKIKLVYSKQTINF